MSAARTLFTAVLLAVAVLPTAARSGIRGDENVTKSKCPLGCSGNGDCVDSTCFCFTNFTGPACNLHRCPGDIATNCTGHGSCNTRTGVCACAPNFAGPACEKQICPAAHKSQGGLACSGPLHGSCSPAERKCACAAGWAGIDCSEPVCSPAGKPCSGHGACNVTKARLGPGGKPVGFGSAKCVCSVGWGGPDCSVKQCDPACRGTAAKPGGGVCVAGDCICRPGFRGPNCDMRVCPGITYRPRVVGVDSPTPSSATVLRLRALGLELPPELGGRDPGESASPTPSHSPSPSPASIDDQQAELESRLGDIALKAQMGHSGILPRAPPPSLDSAFASARHAASADSLDEEADEAAGVRSLFSSADDVSPVLLETHASSSRERRLAAVQAAVALAPHLDLRHAATGDALDRDDVAAALVLLELGNEAAGLAPGEAVSLAGEAVAGDGAYDSAAAMAPRMPAGAAALARTLEDLMAQMGGGDESAEDAGAKGPRFQQLPAAAAQGRASAPLATAHDSAAGRPGVGGSGRSSGVGSLAFQGRVYHARFMSAEARAAAEATAQAEAATEAAAAVRAAAAAALRARAVVEASRNATIDVAVGVTVAADAPGGSNGTVAVFCHGQGSCRANGRCACGPERQGAACELGVCPGFPSPCGFNQSRGECVQNASLPKLAACVCNPGFGGDDCSMRKCRGHCGAAKRRGYCDHLTGQCVCRDGWFGQWDCGSKICPGTRGSNGGCNGRGKCTDGVCVCRAGYSGEVCERLTCPTPVMALHRRALEALALVDAETLPEMLQPSVDEQRRAAMRATGAAALFLELAANETASPSVTSSPSQTASPSQSPTALASAAPDAPSNTTNETRPVLPGDVAHMLAAQRGWDLLTAAQREALAADAVQRLRLSPDAVVLPCGGMPTGMCGETDGVCFCHPSRTGASCQLRTCPRACSGRGVCVDGTCHCGLGWKGDDCSERAVMHGRAVARPPPPSAAAAIGVLRSVLAQAEYYADEKRRADAANATNSTGGGSSGSRSGAASRGSNGGSRGGGGGGRSTPRGSVSAASHSSGNGRRAQSGGSAASGSGRASQRQQRGRGGGRGGRRWRWRGRHRFGSAEGLEGDGDEDGGAGEEAGDASSAVDDAAAPHAAATSLAAAASTAASPVSDLAGALSGLEDVLRHQRQARRLQARRDSADGSSSSGAFGGGGGSGLVLLEEAGAASRHSSSSSSSHQRQPPAGWDAPSEPLRLMQQPRLVAASAPRKAYRDIHSASTHGRRRLNRVQSAAHAREAAALASRLASLVLPDFGLTGDEQAGGEWAPPSARSGVECDLGWAGPECSVALPVCHGVAGSRLLAALHATTAAAARDAVRPRQPLPAPDSREAPLPPPLSDEEAAVARETAAAMRKAEEDAEAAARSASPSHSASPSPSAGAAAAAGAADDAKAASFRQRGASLLPPRFAELVLSDAGDGAAVAAGAQLVLLELEGDAEAEAEAEGDAEAEGAGEGEGAAAAAVEATAMTAAEAEADAWAGADAAAESEDSPAASADSTADPDAAAATPSPSASARPAPAPAAPPRLPAALPLARPRMDGCGPHGTCTFTGCLCEQGWLGASCTTHVSALECPMGRAGVLMQAARGPEFVQQEAARTPLRYVAPKPRRRRRSKTKQGAGPAANRASSSSLARFRSDSLSAGFDDVEQAGQESDEEGGGLPEPVQHYPWGDGVADALIPGASSASPASAGREGSSGDAAASEPWAALVRDGDATAAASAPSNGAAAVHPPRHAPGPGAQQQLHRFSAFSSAAGAVAAAAAAAEAEARAASFRLERSDRDAAVASWAPPSLSETLREALARGRSRGERAEASRASFGSLPGFGAHGGEHLGPAAAFTSSAIPSSAALSTLASARSLFGASDSARLPSAPAPGPAAFVELGRSVAKAGLAQRSLSLGEALGSAAMRARDRDLDSKRRDDDDDDKPSKSSSQTPTRTTTPSSTNTPSPSVTPSQTPSQTATPSSTQTPSQTRTPTQTRTPSATETPTPTASRTPSQSPTPSYAPVSVRLGYGAGMVCSGRGTCELHIDGLGGAREAAAVTHARGLGRLLHTWAHWPTRRRKSAAAGAPARHGAPAGVSFGPFKSYDDFDEDVPPPLNRSLYSTRRRRSDGGSRSNATLSDAAEDAADAAALERAIDASESTGLKAAVSVAKLGVQMPRAPNAGTTPLMAGLEALAKATAKREAARVGNSTNATGANATAAARGPPSVSGVCHCLEGFRGPACEERYVTPGRGVCDPATGICWCLTIAESIAAAAASVKAAKLARHSVPAHVHALAAAPGPAFEGQAWTGGTCASRSCAPGCERHGICHAKSGVCACLPGWAGADCGVAACPHECSFHGRCLLRSREDREAAKEDREAAKEEAKDAGAAPPPATECRCDPGWKGAACGRRACPNDCSGNGACGRDARCRCTPGWFGDDCSVPVALPGAAGAGARVGGVRPLVLFNASDDAACGGCHGARGVCMPDPTRGASAYACFCKPGYYGKHCEGRSCPAACNGQGLCSRNGACTCLPGWTGDDCGTKVAPAPAAGAGAKAASGGSSSSSSGSSAGSESRFKSSSGGGSNTASASAGSSSLFGGVFGL